MSTDPMRFRKKLKDELPYPVAISYKRVCACVSDNEEKRGHLLHTADMLVRTLASIALCDARRAFRGSSVPACALSEEFGRRFEKPTAGTWLWMLREALALLRDARREPFVREIMEFYFDPRGKPTSAVHALEDIVTIRNREIHEPQQASGRKEREVADACGQLQELLERVLGASLFLSDYPLAFVSPITVHKRRDEEPTYQRETYVIQGHSDVFEGQRIPSSLVCEDGDVLLLRNGSDDYLSLDPLLLCSNEGSTGFKDVFVYSKTRNGVAYYLACNKGGGLSSRDLAATDYVERGIAEIIGLFEGGRQ